MKDYSKKELENSRPSEDSLTCINHCLNALYKDQTKNTADNVVENLSFEELIGALLLARDCCEDE